MKRLALAIVIAASVLIIPEALAFQPGERVRVGSGINKNGTVLEDTGKLVKIHHDDSGYSADVGVWYDKGQVEVTSGTGGATAPPVTNSTSTNSSPGSGASNTSGAGSYKAGERVRVGSINKMGTILQDTGTMVKVHLDGSGYNSEVGVWYDKEQLKEPASTGGVPIRTGSGGGISITPANGSNPPAPSSPRPGGNTGNTAKQPPANTTQSAPSTEKSAGAPPDGIYTCNKISVGKYIHIGTIEIRGGSYKGFSSQQGGFHPYSMDGSGNIVWTAGLTGFPDGWTLKPAKYVGPDYKGHPLIRVYYTSARGAAEVIDATKEK